MPKIELEMTAVELEQHELDCYETIQIIEQAETVWVELEIVLPLLENCMEARGLGGDKLDDSPQLEEPFDDYTRYITEVRELIASISDSIHYVNPRGNTVEIGQLFEDYEAAKEQADEWEEQPLSVWSQVTLKALASDLPQESLEQMEQKKQASGGKNHE